MWDEKGGGEKKREREEGKKRGKKNIGNEEDTGNE